MTNEDIIRMAREANIGTYINLDSYLVGSHLERFAELVAAEEREAIATEFMERHEAVKHLNNYWHHAANYVRARGQHD